jgi:hypothetical protein
MSVVSGIMGANATEDAAETNADATDASIAEQRRQFNTTQENMKPWLTSGTDAVNRLSSGLQPGGQFASTPTFQFDPSKVQTDPGYDFRMKQGVNAITAAGAAAGNLGSGNLGVALQNYGQDLGSQEYGAAYQRAYGSQMDAFNSNLNAQNNQFNRLSGVAGTGQTAATQLGAAGMQMAQGVGNTLIQGAANQGNIRMAGAANQSNIMNSGIQTGVNAYGAYNQNQQYQNYLNNGSLYNDAGGNINNVDFGSFGDTSSMSW